jgi:hypothetical protein
MKTTTNRWMLRSTMTHEIVSLYSATKGRMTRILQESGRTDLELVQVTW